MQIYANYHTHTYRCGHATGEDREYVEKAIECGYKILGFSDHTPYPVPGFVSGMRMKLEETDGYFASLESLRKEYKDDIDIYFGVEAEYFPEYFDALTEFLRDYPLDYMIMGNHFVPCEHKGTYIGGDFKDPAALHMYTKNVIEGLSTGRFMYLAHPDLPRYTGPNKEEELEKCYREICAAALRLNIPLEINMLGYTRRPASVYPNDKFFDIAKETGNDVIIGVDAHFPEALANEVAIDSCVEMATSRGLNLLKEIKIKCV